VLDTGFDPDQSPDALQLVALVVDQLRVVAPPGVTSVGAALSDTVGTAVGVGVGFGEGLDAGLDVGDPDGWNG